MELITLSYAGVTALEYKQMTEKQSSVMTGGLKKKINYASSLNPVFLKEKLKEKEISTVTILEDEYPHLLKEIYDPPYILYLKGDSSLLNRDMLGVVGSRKAGAYTRKSLETLIPELKEYVIVSGLAYGADETAHTVSLINDVKTIGILAFGHDIHYPKTTEKTRQIIEDKGLTISEYPPHSTIEKWKFIGRNRIISGLSKGILVTEAEENSGSLITLDMALNENRSGMCLPGNITSALSTGTNKRIQEGAKSVLSSSDIIQELNPDYLV
ncbi:DNA-processing protein DprA [Corticicoccus populi]|uniref:DNA-processing protein DprA n=1 Tax=Corticicoccus populi TaxID=1812821 RepID=A0ABW5WTB2_9STAP